MTSEKINQRSGSLNWQRFTLVTQSFLLKLEKKRRKTAIDNSSKIDKFKKVLPWLTVSIQPNWIKLIRKKIIIEIKIV